MDTPEGGSKTGGTYNVNESGHKFRHQPRTSIPKDGEEFLAIFREGFNMKILDQPTEKELVFEIVGVDASFANALRRIMLSEIPTMAIEHVYMADNTSIVHDEVLAHRLGLVPLNVDARLFDEYANDDDNYVDETGDGEAEEAHQATDRNALVFRLAVACSKAEAKNNNNNKNRKDFSNIDDTVLGSDDLEEEMATTTTTTTTGSQMDTPKRPFTKHVYSGDLEWVPRGEQESRFPEGIRPVHEDILLAKIRPGQSIELEAHAHRGIGKDHAKYSPVATACYRLMPKVELIKDVYDDLAEELAHLYEPGVFCLVETDSGDPPGTKIKAQVSNPYACTMSRNFMRNATLAESIRMTRIPNHFIFSVESVGMLPPAVLVAEALRVLQSKCQRLMDLMEDIEDNNNDDNNNDNDDET